jgi:hypothetical protein
LLSKSFHFVELSFTFLVLHRNYRTNQVVISAGKTRIVSPSSN